MTQPKPPIFLVFDTEGKVLNTLRSENAARVWCERNGSEVVRYEPAVPKCATCPYFTPPSAPAEKIDGMCRELSFSGDTVPSDGSGYCWRHPEANR